MTFPNNPGSNFGVAVVGAGVFGAWTALILHRAGRRVVLLDGHGPANDRASSGDESRIIRMGYGADEVYTRSALRSFELWHEFIAQGHHEALFHRTGVLWLAHEGDPYVLETKQTLQRVGVRCEELALSELERRYPQIDFVDVSWGLLEPDSGALMASNLVQAVVEEALRGGVTYFNETVTEPVAAETARLQEIKTVSGRRISADAFIFACGPWLPALFPELLGDLIHPTRQEVFFFGVPNSDFASPALPAWVDFHDLVYAIPDFDGRGLKLAIDRHGPPFDPETGDRTASDEGMIEARQHLARRLPSLQTAPVLEARVCQYENTANGDFLIDRHPGFENVWLAGGGSGHGFKHGPAVGEYVAGLLDGRSVLEPRFALATKARSRERAVY